MRRAILFVLAMLCAAAGAPAQRFDLEKDRLPIADLNRQWRFHMGDDPRWANPGFDDSHWGLLKPDQPWSASGEKDVDGFAWYRFEVRIPADVREPSLFLPQLWVYSFQVFADGKLIGSVGTFPPHQQIDLVPFLICPLPTGNTGERDITIAIRAWNWVKGRLDSPLGANVRIGAREQIDAWARAAILGEFWRMSFAGYMLLIYLIGSGALLLFFLRQNEKEYLWFGLYGLSGVLSYSYEFYGPFYPVAYASYWLGFVALFSMNDWICVYFFESLVKRRHWAFLLARFGIALTAIAFSLLVRPRFTPGRSPPLLHSQISWSR
jgi:hypothetical protein